MRQKADEVRQVSEQEALEVAEGAREKEVKATGFLKELFLGNYDLDLIYPLHARAERPEFREFYLRLKAFLRDVVDPVRIDTTGEYPPEVIEGLRRLGAFGMKIPVEYGGLGLNQVEYSEVMKLVGGYDANITALLSAHQSIGVPQPLKLFGTPEQKRRWLPRLAAGAISAFALTEPDVGSDPARLNTTARREGDSYVLNGEKLWCTNGTLAEIILVMARHPDTGKISAFVVETKTPGVKVTHRCRFMGLKALANAVLKLDEVRVPVENRIGEEGHGLKIALVTLNTGRLSIPAGTVGAARAMLEICRGWCNERVQWGRPIGRHEAVGQKLAEMAADTFAMEAVSDLASQLAERHGYDIRLEAAAAKEWNTARSWKMIDDAMQIRGGRGYETESSLMGRGEPAFGVERAMRDARINRIFEGSSEIMHLFIAREAVDRHLRVASVLIDRNATARDRALALPKIGLFYAGWYPRRYIGWAAWPKYRRFGKLAKHLRFAERASRRLARATFQGMAVHRAKLQNRQGFLFRLVDVGLELFAISATVARAQQMVDEGQAEHASAVALADLFCRTCERRVRQAFRELWRNEDARKMRLASSILAGSYAWLEQGGLSVSEEGRPKAAAAPREERRAGDEAA